MFFLKSSVLLCLFNSTLQASQNRGEGRAQVPATPIRAGAWHQGRWQHQERENTARGKILRPDSPLHTQIGRNKAVRKKSDGLLLFLLPLLLLLL